MNPSPNDTSSFSAPCWALTSFEPVRAFLEYTSMRLTTTAPLPSGDGHPVVLFPGLASDKHAIGPLKSFCNKLGYTAYD